MRARSLSISVQADGRRDAAGRVLYRARIPFAFDAAMGVRRVVVGGEAQREAGAEAPAAETGRGEEWEEVEGPASSTSVDWYGTRMSRNALESMLRQFTTGRDYMPRHHRWSAPVEWYECIGRTHGGELRRETVKEPSEEGGEQFVLYVRTRIDLGVELGRTLIERIAKGWKIGQSIGGWFTEIAVKYNEEGDVTDIEILDVELDHLAAVRAPACPDADRIWLATSRALIEAGGDTRARARARTEHPELPVEQRSGGEIIVRCQLDEEGSDPEAEEDRAAARSVQPAGAPSAASVPAVQRNDGDAAPRPVGEPAAARDTEENHTMDPTQLAALIAEQMRAALTPVTDRLAALEGQRAAPAPAATPAPSPAPAPAPAPAARSVEDEILVLRQRVELAELRAREAVATAQTAQTLAAAGGAQRAGQHATGAPTVPGENRGAGDDVVAGIRGKVEGPNGVDMRTIAPRAVKMALQSRGTVELNAGLVLEQDGLRGVVAYAEAEGRSLNIVEVARGNDLLLSNRRSAVRDLAASYGPIARELNASSKIEPGWQDRQGLEDLLYDVMNAAQRDGLLNPDRRLWLGA
jgi:hypothetical protein